MAEHLRCRSKILLDIRVIIIRYRCINFNKSILKIKGFYLFSVFKIKGSVPSPNAYCDHWGK